MDPLEIERRFRALNVWSSGDQRAPHKPLLLLYALGRAVAGGERLIPFREVDRPLAALLREFGPVRSRIHPEYPFYRLKNDGVWEVKADGDLQPRTGHEDPKRSELLRLNARAGFTVEIADALRRDPALVYVLAHSILDAHFPASLHEDLLNATGLDQPVMPTRARRDPAFRELVLTAYERRCAVCGFDIRLGGAQLGLDAAHIKWHQAGGPDLIENGLALCAIHHKLFDRGAFTLSHEHSVLLSQHVHGSAGFESVLLRYHGRPILRTQDPSWMPQGEYIGWHHREVFQQPARHLPSGD